MLAPPIAGAKEIREQIRSRALTQQFDNFFFWRCITSIYFHLILYLVFCNDIYSSHYSFASALQLSCGSIKPAAWHSSTITMHHTYQLNQDFIKGYYSVHEKNTVSNNYFKTTSLHGALINCCSKSAISLFA
jgi:hypothetical protein